MPGKLNSAANATRKFLARSPLLNHGQSSKPVKSSSLKSSDSSLSIDSGYASDPESMDLFKRHSLALGKSRRDSNTSRDAVSKSTGLSMLVESPPLVSYGPSDESSGALFSGQLVLKVLKAQTYNSIKLQLVCVKTIKKPVAKDCPICSGFRNNLKDWDFTPQPLTLDVGEHKFPISHLFKGDLPATTHSQLALLDYHFTATATTSSGETIKLNHTVELQRAIRPGVDRQSIRVFPPTNITAHVTLSPVCYSNSEIPIKLKIAGIKSSNDNGRSENRWRLRKMVWRIEEHQNILSPGCPKHTSKIPEGQTGIKHEEIKILGEHDVNYNKTPWKTDLTEGEIVCEFVATINANKKAACGVAIPEINLQIQHFLVMEMIVVEEQVFRKRPQQATPTGAARILRSQYPLRITNRAGLGVPWDEETPPTYQNVPPSPPGYSAGERLLPTTPGLAQIAEIDISTLNDGIEEFHLGEPHELARASRFGGSASTVTRRSSSSSGEMSGRFNMRLSADDLMQEPPEYRSRREDEIEEEVDIETVASPTTRR